MSRLLALAPFFATLLASAPAFSAAPIVDVVKVAVARTSDEAFAIVMNAADEQAASDCANLGYFGKPVDASTEPQGTAFPVNGGRQWQAEWRASYLCTDPAPQSDAIVIAEGHGRALSSMPAAESLARSRALRQARDLCLSDFGRTGVPTVYQVETSTTECPGDRYCYATFIAQYNCW